VKNTSEISPQPSGRDSSGARIQVGFFLVRGKPARKLGKGCRSRNEDERVGLKKRGGGAEKDEASQRRWIERNKGNRVRKKAVRELRLGKGGSHPGRMNKL